MTRKIETIRGFVYDVEDPLNKSAAEYAEKFKIENLGTTQVPYGSGHTLVVVVDSVKKEKYICGRLLKLRRFIPSVLNKKSAKERDIPILPEEDIIESSHFIWIHEKKKLLGEYNHDGARHFSTPFYAYFNRIYNRTETAEEEEEGIRKEKYEFIPIKNPKTLDLLKKDLAKSVSVRVNDANIKSFEDETNSDVIGLLGDFGAPNKKGYVEITLKPQHGKRFNMKKLIKKVLAIKEKRIAKALWVDGENAAYDILNNNLLPYNIEVTYDSEKRRTDAEEFYERSIEYYELNEAALT